MKTKELGPVGGVRRHAPLDPPMYDVRQLHEVNFLLPDHSSHTDDFEGINPVKEPNSGPSRPKKPVNKPKFSMLGPKQARPRSAPPGRAAKNISEKPKQPPFLAFGYRDKEREIGAKKTHNVRASAEVRIYSSFSKLAEIFNIYM